MQKQNPPLRRGAVLCFFLSCLFAANFCHASDKTVEVVGTGECADCKESNFKTSHAFAGLRVTIDCKTDGDLKTRGSGQLDAEGNFKVIVSDGIVKDGKLNQECYAKLHSAAAKPCPTLDDVESSKIILKSDKDGKQTLGIVGKLKFSPSNCASAFFWHFFHQPPLPTVPVTYPPFPGHPYLNKPLPPPTPVYQPPTPVYQPPTPVYQPPTPVYQPPTLPPPVPVYKHPVLPPPTPVHTKPPSVPTPVYKKPKPKCKTPVYKHPVYKHPVYKHPVYKKPYTPVPVSVPVPVPVYKPPAPVYTKPLPPPIPVYKPKHPYFKHLPPFPPLPPLYKKPLPPYPSHPIFGGFPPLPPHPKYGLLPPLPPHPKYGLLPPHPFHP